MHSQAVEHLSVFMLLHPQAAIEKYEVFIQTVNSILISGCGQLSLRQLRKKRPVVVLLRAGTGAQTQLCPM